MIAKNLLGFQTAFDLEPRVMLAAAPAQTYNPSNFTPDTISKIKANQTVRLANGNYNMTDARIRALNKLPNGVTLTSANPRGATLDFSKYKETKNILIRGKKNVTFNNLHFKNGSVSVANSSGTKITNNKFDGYGGKKMDIINDRIISVKNSTGNTTVTGNDINWVNKANNGDGSRNKQGVNKSFGNLHAIEIQQQTGKSGKTTVSRNKISGNLRMGIGYNNASGGSVEINNNNINRIPGTPESTANRKFSDHGIYAHSSKNSKVSINGNNVRGWKSDGSGGAVKLKDIQNVQIKNNNFSRSGVLFRGGLKNINVSNNTVKNAKWGLDFDIGKGDPAPSGVRLENNNLNGSSLSIREKGTIKPAGFNKSVNAGGKSQPGGVYGNKNADITAPDDLTKINGLSPNKGNTGKLNGKKL